MAERYHALSRLRRGVFHVRTSTVTAQGERVGGEPTHAMTPHERPADPVALTPVAGVKPYYPQWAGEEHAEKMRVATATEDRWENCAMTPKGAQHEF